MIRITIELLPWGDESRARGRPKEVWKKSEVKGFPRRRLGPWDLLYRALRIAVGDWNKA